MDAQAASTTHEEDALLTVEEAARVLRVSPDTVRRRIAAGELPALRVGGSSQAPVRISRSALEDLLRPFVRATSRLRRRR